jgi:hypothetical protein
VCLTVLTLLKSLPFLFTYTYGFLFGVFLFRTPLFVNCILGESLPYDSLYFYYHGLAHENWGILKWETVVNGLTLRLAIGESLPRCGMRPTASAELYATHKAEGERKKSPKKRCAILPEELLTNSQTKWMVSASVIYFCLQ